ncbi:MAG: alpha/beta fold hydrolase [Candidatus Puniceispirillaceae bacterium]
MRDLILLPGMMCDARLFAPQIAALQDRVRVMVPLPVCAPEMSRLAANVLADAPDRFALGGVSMGGILAMEIMRQAPQRVTHLALIDTNPFAERDEMKARRGPQMEAVRHGRLATVMRDEMKPNYFTHRDDSAALRDLAMAMATDLGADAFIAQSLALRDRPDYEETLRAVTCPTLILCGRHDHLCPVERHEAMKAMIPHARLCIIEDAGHLPTIETPDIVTIALQELLEIHHG